VSTLYDYEEFQSYLFELESALSTVGIRDCEGLRSPTQLAAAVCCMLRAGFWLEWGQSHNWTVFPPLFRVFVRCIPIDSRPARCKH
jgi:hypothetical protein